MQQIEILRIENPFDFFVTEKDPKGFLDLVNETIRREESTNAGARINDSNLATWQKDMILAVHMADTQKWYRAQIISRISSFRGRTDSLRCHLVDLAETVTVSCSSCKEIKDSKLKKLPPLAKKCLLFGIEPTSPSLYVHLISFHFFLRVNLFRLKIFSSFL